MSRGKIQNISSPVPVNHILRLRRRAIQAQGPAQSCQIILPFLYPGELLHCGYNLVVDMYYHLQTSGVIEWSMRERKPFS